MPGSGHSRSGVRWDILAPASLFGLSILAALFRLPYAAEAVLVSLVAMIVIPLAMRRRRRRPDLGIAPEGAPMPPHTSFGSSANTQGPTATTAIASAVAADASVPEGPTDADAGIDAGFDGGFGSDFGGD